MKIVFGEFTAYSAEKIKKSNNLFDQDFIGLDNLTSEDWDKEAITYRLKKVKLKLEDILKNEDKQNPLLFLRGKGEVQDFISAFLKESGFRVEEKFIDEEEDIKKQQRKKQILKSDSKLYKRS